MKLIIAISGRTGSGKDTLGKRLSRTLRIRHVNPTFKDLARAEGIPLMEFQKRAAQDPDIDKKFDRLLKREAKRGACVATSWLSPWMLKADVRIYLFAPLEIRARRVAGRDALQLRAAMAHVQKRDAQNRKRYLKLYGIDIYDTGIFDICLNSAKFKPAALEKIVLAIVNQKQPKKQRKE